LTFLPKFINRTAIVLVCYCAFSIGSSAADESTSLKDAVDATIRPLMVENDIPGMAVAVIVDSKISYFNYGLASKEKQTPVTEATLFEIGSVSKTFTATLASYALVTGKMSLDDHPAKYVPQLKGSPIDKATLKNLGTYTAGGLPLQFPDEVTETQMLDYFRQFKPEAAPGAKRRYSNPSLGLFGYITALALKQDFADVMENQLFPQLGLRSTYIHVPETALPNYAWGYDKTNQAVHVTPGALDVETYGVKSTSADMIRYVQLNLNPSLLDGTVQDALKGTHVAYFKVGDLLQGLGWEQFPYPITLQKLLSGNSEIMLYESNPASPLEVAQRHQDSTLYDKTGSTGGFGTYVLFVPEKKIGIVLLANKNYPIPARVKAAYAILDHLARH
jgi:beta-lactamase class C